MPARKKTLRKQPPIDITTNNPDTRSSRMDQEDDKTVTSFDKHRVSTHAQQINYTRSEDQPFRAVDRTTDQNEVISQYTLRSGSPTGFHPSLRKTHHFTASQAMQGTGRRSEISVRKTIDGSRSRQVEILPESDDGMRESELRSKQSSFQLWRLNFRCLLDFGSGFWQSLWIWVSQIFAKKWIAALGLLMILFALLFRFNSGADRELSFPNLDVEASKELKMNEIEKESAKDAALNEEALNKMEHRIKSEMFDYIKHQIDRIENMLSPNALQTDPVDEDYEYLSGRVIAHSSIYSKDINCYAEKHILTSCMTYHWMGPILNTVSSKRVHPLADEFVHRGSITEMPCLPLSGQHGYLTVQFPVPYTVARFYMMKPIILKVLPQKRLALLKEFSIQGVDDKGMAVSFGKFILTETGATIQVFSIATPTTTQFLKIQVLSNHGHPDYTCLPKIQFYGNI